MLTRVEQNRGPRVGMSGAALGSFRVHGYAPPVIVIAEADGTEGQTTMGEK